MHFPTRLFRWVIVAGALAVFGVVWLLFGDSKVSVVVAIAALLVAILQLLPSLMPRWLAAAPSRPDQIDDAAQALIRQVRNQWTAEQHRRGLEDPNSMPIQWSVDRNVSGRAVPKGTPSSGDLATIVEQYAARPSRLVVTGGPGSGKTGLCVILTVKLLASQSGNQNIPYLVPLSTWNRSENLNTWLARRLAEDYPWLTVPSNYGSTACDELVAQQRILPLLDGLDEVPESSRAEVLDAVLQDLAGQPFVLTCRSGEWAEVQANGTFGDLFVIQLLPLESAAAANYLLEAVSGSGLDRWDKVLSRLSEGGTGIIETVCTQPWTLFLLQAVYRAPDRDPSELLDTDRFPSLERVEDQLLDEFVRTAFPTRPPPRERGAPSARRWDPDRSERGLIFLAKVLHEWSYRELAWWDLAALLPAWFSPLLRVSIASIADAGLCALLFGLFGRPLLGAVFGFVTGGIVALALGLVSAERPRRLVLWSNRRRFAIRSFLLDVGFILVGAVGGGAIVYILYGPWPAVLAGIAFGLVFAAVRRLIEPTEPENALSPASVLHDDRRSVLYATGIGWLAGAVVGGLLGGLAGGNTQGLIWDLNTWERSLLGGAIGATLCAAALGAMMHSNSASGRFVTTQYWLRARRLTPTPLIAFLDEAHRLGLLRQIGPYYQFRHASLQDRLAARPLPTDKHRRLGASQRDQGSLAVARTGLVELRYPQGPGKVVVSIV